MTERTPVDLWFDPFCPFAWMTSRWLLEVEKVRPIEPRWHVMSLKVLNEDKDVPESYRTMVERTIGMVRVVTAVQQKHDSETVGRLYTELGTRLHNQGRAKESEKFPELVAEALEAAGLDQGFADAMDSEEFDEALRASHNDGIDRVGQEVGTPVISVDGVAFFGPVISPAPKGEAAGRLWDGVRLVAGTDGFFELKRSRTRAPIFD
ncbi:Predicted dithiol-disulfide isomerase, DsbA family [Streptosporangium subroseum]|uniref:Predicted dithiol-disulfide isomerase, DsbA family n=1 Tax=Streptosporangium subroseum TaxID=106412 RepID=A0A239KA22_9ACTN|nr:DsbA family protein [Streptosporangium subroseum]SNT14542.1 Predicted dithiol-disulfide isomerase, DsbA family [Streptosporangium subroseum]